MSGWLAFRRSDREADQAGKTSKCTSVQKKIAEHMVARAEITVLNLTTTASISLADVPRPRGFAGHALDVFP